jgi:hypothetical protein
MSITDIVRRITNEIVIHFPAPAGWVKELQSADANGFILGFLRGNDGRVYRVSITVYAEEATDANAYPANETVYPQIASPKNPPVTTVKSAA